MKGRKREGGRDKGRGRERGREGARVHWIGIGGDCVMLEGGGGGGGGGGIADTGGRGKLERGGGQNGKDAEIERKKGTLVRGERKRRNRNS